MKLTKVQPLGEYAIDDYGSFYREETLPSVKETNRSFFSYSNHICNMFQSQEANLKQAAEDVKNETVEDDNLKKQISHVFEL